MKANESNTAGVVSALLTPLVTGMGYTLWDVEYVKEGNRQVLRITIDREGGVELDDCEAVHRAIDGPLDEADPIAESYYLEVSSPGLERTLRTDAHFAAYLEKPVTLRFYAPFAPLGGAKQYTGTLTAADSTALTLTAGDGTVVIPRDKIADARAYFDFEHDLTAKE